MVHVKYAHVYKGSCKLEVIPLPHEQTHTWIHTDYIFTSIYVYDLDFHTHIHYFHIYISLNINQRSACSQHSFLKNIAYDALLFLKLEHDIRIHLDQTFAWGPHNTEKVAKQPKRPSGHKHSVADKQHTHILFIWFWKIWGNNSSIGRLCSYL